MSPLVLPTHEVGDAALPPILIAHGLFGSARNWGAVAKRLSARRRVVAVDMRNHAEAPWDPDHSYDALAADLAGAIDRIGSPVEVIGHSMGGKAAMVLAARYPDHVARLVIVDIAPVAYGHSQLPLIDAMEGLDLSTVSRRRAADEAFRAQVPDPQVRAFLLQSLDFGREAARWRLNLAALRANMAGIMGFPDALGPIEGPCTLICGARSDYVDEVGFASLARLCPGIQKVTVPDAGHWVHAENPQGFDRALSEVLP